MELAQMALLSSELASVHAMRCIRCGATIVLERPTEPAHRLCSAPGSAGATAECQFVRLCSADRLDEASAQQLLYAIRSAKRRGRLSAQRAAEVRARAAALVAETRALAQKCTVAADRQALLRASTALAEVVLSNGGHVLLGEEVMHAAPAVPAAGEGPLHWMLAALGGGAG